MALRHHSDLARLTDAVGKAAEEINWDAVCSTTKNVHESIIKLRHEVAPTVEALEQIFSLPVSLHLDVIRVEFD